MADDRYLQPPQQSGQPVLASRGYDALADQDTEGITFDPETKSWRANLTRPRILGGPEPPQLDLAAAQAQLPPPSDDEAHAIGRFLAEHQRALQAPRQAAQPPLSLPPPTPGQEPDYGYGFRYHSTEPKGLGYLGTLQRPDRTGVMGEYSIDEGQGEIPSMVPTLTREEVQQILNLPEGAPPPESIRQKAIDFAAQRRAAGLPVFARTGEQENLYPDLPRDQPVGHAQAPPMMPSHGPLQPPQQPVQPRLAPSHGPQAQALPQPPEATRAWQHAESIGPPHAGAHAVPRTFGEMMAVEGPLARLTAASQYLQSLFPGHEEPPSPGVFQHPAPDEALASFPPTAPGGTPSLRGPSAMDYISRLPIAASDAPLPIGKAAETLGTLVAPKAPQMGKALAALKERWPRMSRAMARFQPEVTLEGANRSLPKAFDRLAQDIHDRTLAFQGTSTQPFTGQIEVPKASEGFMFGKYANQTKRTVEVPIAKFSPQTIRDFIEQHARTFAEHPDYYVGTWYDKETGKVFLDVAQKATTQREAVLSAARQTQPTVEKPIKGVEPVVRSATGQWPTPQIAVYDLARGEDVPVGNLAEHLRSPLFQQRADEMYHVGKQVMDGKEWWDLYGSTLERVYGKERVKPLAAMLASTSPGSTPIHNLRAASEYLRRLIKNEPIIQPGFRIPEGSVGSIKGPLGGFNSPGMHMPMEASRAANLQKAASGQYSLLQEDKVNDMFHSLTGHDIGVYDRRFAKLAEDWDKGIYAEFTKDKLQGSMVMKEGRTPDVGSYALIENAMRDGAKRLGLPLPHYTSYVWEGIGETIRRTGELFGMKHPAGAIPELSGGFPELFNMLVRQKAKAWGLTVPQFERLLRSGKTELLTSLLATPVGYAAYRQWQQAVHPTGEAEQ